jgi:hypothetical protein
MEQFESTSLEEQGVESSETTQKAISVNLEGSDAISETADPEKHEIEQSEPKDSEVEEQSHAKEKGHKQLFEEFKKKLEEAGDPEAKLRVSIDFMEATLSQGGMPHFKNFWDARNTCLELFKEEISPIARANLWTRYSSLTKEARRLKELFEEQSAFAVEQIEIAIQAIETETNNPEAGQKVVSPDLDGLSNILNESSVEFYFHTQKDLNHLNAQASLITSLRKELTKTEMRIKQKNKFFQRLSAAGDFVFPKRKDLIREISQKFIEDVDAFVAAHFAEKESNESIFTLREAIKILQNAAKVLTLNTHAFTHTRVRLSECWNSLKEADKERKKVRAQQKVAFKQNFDEVLHCIQAFEQEYASKPMSSTEAFKQLDEISYLLRQKELGRDEARHLKNALFNARKPVQEKLRQEEEERCQQENERESQRKQKMADLKQDCERLVQNNDQETAESLSVKREELLSKIVSSPLTKLEKQELERILKPLRDLIAEKKEQALLVLSDDAKQHLSHLKEVLKEKKERRQDIKNQIEVYRKAVGSSGLDFEQAMTAHAQMASEKERLDKINQGIREIEEKIDSIETA